MTKPKKRRKVLIFTVLGLTMAGLAWSAVVRKREPIITIQTDHVTRRDLTETVVANGKIEPVLEVKISPEVSGEIIQLPVKAGQLVKAGDLLIKIRPDQYLADVNSARASYLAAVANQDLAKESRKKAELEYKRNQQLFDAHLISESSFVDFRTSYEVAVAQVDAAKDQAEVAKAALDRSEEELIKTTIVSPLAGTVSQLNSQLGERVVGTSLMSGTDIMTIADLNDMEARVDVGETDVVLIHPGERARLEVDAFHDRKFNGVVTAVANTSENATNASTSSSGQAQEATKFEVRIHILDKAVFLPGMSVTAEIETRYSTNVLAVPIQCVTTRLSSQLPTLRTNAPMLLAENKSGTAVATDASAGAGAKTNRTDHGPSEAAKSVEVVFVWRDGRARAKPVKRGIADDAFVEISSGLNQGDEVISGGYKAISRELHDGAKIRKGSPAEAKAPTTP